MPSLEIARDALFEAAADAKRATVLPVFSGDQKRRIDVAVSQLLAVANELHDLALEGETAIARSPLGQA
jgi:hypothetical protein